MTYARYPQRRREIAEFVDRYSDEHGYAPSVAEIGRFLGLGTSRVSDPLDRMEGEGLITRPRHDTRPIGRTMRLTDAAMVILKEEL